MQAFSLIYMLLVLLCIQVQSIQIDDSLLITDLPKQHSVDVSSFQNGNIVSIAFSFTDPNIFSTTFVMASFTGYYSASQINLTSFYSKKSSDYSGIMDLNSLKLGKPQYINLITETNNPILYLTVFNLDIILANGQINIGNARSSNIPYKIIITQSPNYVCYSCQNGGQKISNLQYCECQNCNGGFKGSYCSNQAIQLMNNQKMNTFASGQSLTFFQVPPLSTGAQLSIEITAGSAQMFIQSITYDGEFACYTNVNQNLPQSEKYILNQAEKNNIVVSLPQSSAKTSVVVANYLTSTFNIYISYTQNESPTKSNIIVIVVSIVGSLAFIGIVIGCWYVFKNPTEQQLKQIQEIKNKMTQVDIQKYFPTVIIENDLSQQQEWSSQLKKQMENKQKQCVICLNPLLLQDKLKVAYCHHIFHEKCLLQWFKKQLNCPCCRYQFTKPKVVQYYEIVAQQIGKRNPSRMQLIRQLLNSSRPKKEIKRINQEQVICSNMINLYKKKNQASSQRFQDPTSGKSIYEMSSMPIIIS